MTTPTSFRPAWSWQGRWVNRALARLVKPWVARVRLTPRVMKFSQLGFDTVTLALPVHRKVHIAPADVGGVPGEWLTAGRDIIAGRVLLYFHGGGYFFGSPRSHRALTWRLSRACRARVLALNYRQPPDWHYPAPLEDAVRAYRALLERGYEPRNIILGGDSAGGNLALVAMLRIRQLGLPLPAASTLISPWTDLSSSGESVTTNADSDPLIPVSALRFIARAYCGDHSPTEPFISPVHADLDGLPPLLVQVGSTEVLLSDAWRLAERAQAAGVSCELQVWEQMLHVFQVLAGWLPEADAAVDDVGRFVEQAINQAGGEQQLSTRARLVTSTNQS